MTRPMPGPPTDLDCACEWHDEIEPGAWEMMPWCPTHGDWKLPGMRLTDAECAAEYWRSSFDCEDYSLSDGYGDGVVEPISRTRWWMRDPINNDQRKATWHRFATRPHYDEVTS